MGIVLPDQEAKELLTLTRENNRMLKDMRRSAFIGGIFHFVWMVLIFIVIPYISWLYIQPYLEGILGAYQSAQNQSSEITKTINDLKSAGSGFDLQKFFEQFSGGQAK